MKGGIMKRNSCNKSSDDDVLPSSSSSSSLEIPTTFQESEIDQLARRLTEIGFDCAMDFIVKNDRDRVKAALELALSKPIKQIRNLPGYIRYLVKTPGEIPKPVQPGNKYIKGKYGRLVQR